MRIAAIWTSVATVAVLNMVIGLGLLGMTDSTVFGRMLDALHVVLPVSGCLLFAVFARAGRWNGVMIAAAILVGVLVVGALGLTGATFSRGLHLAIDLAALNAYLVLIPLLYQNRSSGSSECGSE